MMETSRIYTSVVLEQKEPNPNHIYSEGKTNIHVYMCDTYRREDETQKCMRAGVHVPLCNTGSLLREKEINH